jgi:peptidoglycan/xylan/chitin deacetylase (PgdA/CDA1 family)
VVSVLKRIAKRVLVRAAARVAPITWRWRRPGSLVVLMYHRVLPKESPARQREQPGMYVSPETFDLHLTELKRRFELVHLDEWLSRARAGLSLPKLACAITFDDGWRDNYEFALPVLTKHEAPATIFLVASYVGTAQRFWPNRLVSLLDKAFAEPGSVDFPEPLKGIIEPMLVQARQRGVLRAEDIDRAIQDAKAVDEEQIRSLVEEAAKGCADLAGTAELLNWSDVAQMAATGLVRFGSHTMTHLRLGGRIPSQDLEREIAGSRSRLLEMLGQEIGLFCYPNGEISPEAVDCVRRHYLGAVTTRGGWHTAGRDPHLIRRIGVHDDVSDTRETLLARVSGWL